MLNTITQTEAVAALTEPQNQESERQESPLKDFLLGIRWHLIPMAIAGAVFITYRLLQ